MSVNIVVTTAGRAAIVNAENTGTAPVTIAQVGISATAVTPVVGATSLSGELKRLSAVPGEVVADDAIHIDVTDDGGDAYSLRSFALYLADGTLFAIYGQADPLIVKTAGSIAALALDVVFADINAASLTFGAVSFTNPAATTTRAGVVRLATLAEAKAGLSATTALTPATGKGAVMDWVLAQDGSGSGLDADFLDGLDASAFLQKAGGTMVGALILAGAPTADLHAATKRYADDIAAAKLAKAGDTMTGLLTLSGDPTASLHAVPKQYADGLVTAAALLAKLLTVDGSGSGLDADLFDGLDSAAFLQKIGGALTGFLTLHADPTAAMHAATRQWVQAQIAAGGLGYTPANRAGDTFTGAVGRDATFYLNMLSSNPVLNFDSADYLLYDRTANTLGLYIGGVARALFSSTGVLTMSSGFTVGANGVWHAGNDGSGSGLDADLLDGRHASDFMLAADATKYGSNANGYWEKRANGIIEQEGVVSGSFAQGSYTRTYPIAFPAGYTVIMQGTVTNPSGGTSAGYDFGFQVKDVASSMSTFDFVLQDYGNTGTCPGFHWRAKGYPP